eukprot:scaffold64003_cov42-Phaeocystis_antarctica.AAC.1
MENVVQGKAIIMESKFLSLACCMSSAYLASFMRSSAQPPPTETSLSRLVTSFQPNDLIRSDKPLAR